MSFPTVDVDQLNRVIGGAFTAAALHSDSLNQIKQSVTQPGGSESRSNGRSGGESRARAARGDW